MTGFRLSFYGETKAVLRLEKKKKKTHSTLFLCQIASLASSRYIPIQVPEAHPAYYAYSSDQVGG
jgi:hypothetical protein